MALFDYKQERENGWEFLTLQLANGQDVKGEFYDATALKNVPKGKYDYYLRHADYDLTKPVGIKRYKGITVNFMGTIVLDKPVEFTDNEIEVVEYGYGELI
jgi:hypothetical protein